MILERGMAQHWPAGTVTAIEVLNVSGTTARLELEGDAFTVDPDARADIRAPEDREVVLENVGAVAVELSWVTGYERVRDDPHYEGAVERSRLTESQRQAIVKSWNEAFNPDNPFYLPAQFGGEFDPMTLLPVSGIGLGRGFTELCPGYQKGTSWSDGDARCDLKNMVARGLRTVQSDRDPTFADNDRSVTYRLKMDSFDLDGVVDVIQPCCIGFLGLCVSTTDARSWSEFKMTFKDVVLAFDAVVVEPTDDQPLSVSVTGTRVEKRGGIDLSFKNAFVEWMAWLLGNWARTRAFTDATDMAATLHLEQGGIRRALETVMNADLQAAVVGR